LGRGDETSAIPPSISARARDTERLAVAVKVDPGGERCGSGSLGELDPLFFFSICSG